MSIYSLPSTNSHILLLIHNATTYGSIELELFQQDYQQLDVTEK